MALRIGLPGSSAFQNDGLDVPVILQCRAPRETNPRGHWGPNCFLRNSLFFASLVVLVCLGPLKSMADIPRWHRSICTGAGVTHCTLSIGHRWRRGEVPFWENHVWAH